MSLAKVKAYAAAMALADAIEGARLPLGTQDAVDLATELSASGVKFRHDDKVKAAVAAWGDIGPMPEDVEQGIYYGRKVARLASEFWDEFEGEVVEGVEIIRRREA